MNVCCWTTFATYDTVMKELVEEAGLPIVNNIPSMVKSHVNLASYLVEDAFGSVADISKNVISHYMGAGRMQVGLSYPCFLPRASSFYIVPAEC